MRALRNIALIGSLIAAAAIAPLRKLRDKLPGAAPRRIVGSSTVGKRLSLPTETLAKLRLTAGITPGMSRTIRRERGRQLAKQLARIAQADGVTVAMPRAERRRRQKALASIIGGATYGGR